MISKIVHIDEMINECPFFFCADAKASVNDGYNCKHSKQDEFGMIDDAIIGKCCSWSCPLGREATEKDFEDVDIDKNGWDVNDYEEHLFLVIETEEEVYARNIHECLDCPLYNNDCPGGATGTPNGYREPPCTSWNDDTLVFAGMYSDCDF